MRLNSTWNRRGFLGTAAAMVAILGVVVVAYFAVRHEQFKQVDNNLRHQAQDVHLIVVPIGNGQYEVSAPRQPGEISGYLQVVSAEGGRSKDFRRHGLSTSATSDRVSTSPTTQALAAPRARAFSTRASARSAGTLMSKPPEVWAS